MQLAPGDRLGPYEVLSPLGRGGMGDVYRAVDPRLDRPVALKVLPDEISADVAMLSRFEQEARAASALNHPNIVTIYDIGETADRRYIAMELVEGESLSATLRKGPLSVRHALQAAIQIARGLAAAHSRGIVHRDLKPENVMMNPDGLVKILDFGLAKLLAAPSHNARMTTPGFIVGTPAYMSPEQARGGANLDFRSDQFSFGALLYELVTGHHPFDRDTAVETMSAILKERPKPVGTLAPEAPIPLQWIIERCLNKEPDQRYASTRDLARDLEEIQGRFEELTSQTRAPAKGEDLSASAPAIRSVRRRRAGLAAIVAVGALAAALGGWTLATRERQTPLLTYLTYSGKDYNPAASPDGRTIAFSSSRDGTRRLWLKQIPGGAEVPLTSGPDDYPRFSPDGATILFTRLAGPKPEDLSLYRVPAVGGEVRRVLEHAARADWSHDGRRLAFLRPLSRGEEVGFEVMVSAADGSSSQAIGREEGPVVGDPRFSPDDQWVVYPSGNGTFGNPWTLVLLNVSTGERRTTAPPDRTGNISSVAFTSAGLGLLRKSRMLFAQSTSVIPNVTNGRVFLQGLSSSNARPVLSSLTMGRVLDVAGSGLLVWNAESVRQNLRELRLGAHPSSTDAPALPRWLTRGQSLDREPVYQASGDRLVFSSNRDRNLDLWEVSTKTGAVRRLTDDAADDWDPYLTRDGRSLLWSSRRSGRFEIWQAEPDGSNARPVTQFPSGAENPSASADGATIVFASYQKPDLGIWKVRREDPRPVPVFRGRVGPPDVSPDGRFVCYVTGHLGHATLKVLRIDNGTVVPFEVPIVARSQEEGYILGRPKWTPDGRAIAFIGQDESGLSGVFLCEFLPGQEAAPLRKLAGFDPESVVESFGFSPDGTRLALAVRDAVSNLVLAEGVPEAERAERAEPSGRSTK